MKITVPRAALVKALQKPASVTGPRSTLPILSNVLLKAEGGKLTLIGTDLEVRVETVIDATVERDGATTLPAGKLTQMITACKGETLDIDVNEQHHARIVCGSVNFLLYGLAPEEFPVGMDAPIVRELSMPQTEMASAIAQVAYSVNPDESRRILTGILFSVKNGLFVTAGTDGKRLALVEKNAPAFSGAEGDAVIPLRSAKQLRQILDNQGEVKLAMSDKHAVFSFGFDNGGSCQMSCKLLEGNYPNFRQVIPKELALCVSVPAKAFSDALKCVSLASGGETPVTKLTFVSGLLRLDAHSDGIGEGQDSVPVDYTGPELVLHLNTRFIADPFDSATTESLNVKMNDGASPIVLESGTGFLSVIMPIRGRTPAPAAS